MSLRIGFAQLEITPFLDSTFALDTARQVVLTPGAFDAADEQTLTQKADTTTVVRGDGGKEVYDNPDPENGIYNFTILEDPNDATQQLLNKLIFPETVTTVDGAKIKEEVFANPGQLRSEWPLMVKTVVKPLTTAKVPVAPNLWVTLPRCVITPNRTTSFAVAPSKNALTIVSLGGRDSGTLALALGDIDLSGTVDLSSGATDKLINVTIDGVLKENINFGQSATTAGNDILDAINTAFNLAVATLDSNGFLNVKSVQPGGTVTIDDPTAGTSGFLLVYQSGGTPPDTVNGTAPFDVPVIIRGDETAT